MHVKPSNFRRGMLEPKVNMNMLTAKRRRSWLACLAAGLLLFAQFALAAQACVPVHEDQGCEGMPAGSGACLAHCVAQDQSAASLEQHFHAVPASAAVAFTVFAPCAAQHAAAPARDARLRSAPSLQILYCSFQT